MARRKLPDFAFVCPYCNRSCNGIVKDSRNGNGYRIRRRVCEFCGKRFTTQEVISSKVGD